MLFASDGVIFMIKKPYFHFFVEIWLLFFCLSNIFLLRQGVVRLTKDAVIILFSFRPCPFRQDVVLNDPDYHPTTVSFKPCPFRQSVVPKSASLAVLGAQVSDPIDFDRV